MSLIRTILTFFNKQNKKPVDDWWNKPHQEILSDIEIYKRKHLEEAAVQAQALEQKFGKDFYRVFYQPNIDKFIREQLIPVKEPDIKYTGFLDQDHWLKKHPFNFPGPFFCGRV